MIITRDIKKRLNKIKQLFTIKRNSLQNTGTLEDFLNLLKVSPENLQLLYLHLKNKTKLREKRALPTKGTGIFLS